MRIGALLFGLLITLATAQEDFDRLTFHSAPKPLAPEAKTQDWPRFLGPNDDATTSETHLLAEWPESGPKLVWEVEKGEGYASPVIAGERLVLYHNLDDVDIIECLHPETGKRYWKFETPNRYRDRFGYSNGPRASAVIADGRVYTLAPNSWMRCLSLESGEEIWVRDLARDFGIEQYFFGHGPNPLILNGKVIMNLGGSKGVCVAAFDARTGETIWETPHEWHASYASPVAATLHGQQKLLVFAGGESRPSVGGLLLIDPETGELHDAFPWRAEKYESVNASTPLVIPGNRILITETYANGGVLLQVSEDFSFSPIWKAQEFKCHWSQPLFLDGHFYAFTGRNEPDAGLDCWDATTGERKWREEMFWKQQIDGRSFGWSYFRGSLLRADDRVYALGELGTFAVLELTPEGVTEKNRVELFSARQSWTLPAISRGLLYVCQNQRELKTESKPRLRCYDFRRVE